MQVKFEHVFYTYSPHTPFSFDALKDINVDLNGHFFMALVGQTGSGKSTFVQHINGLVLPSQGRVTIDQYQMYTDGKKRYFLDLTKKDDKKISKKRKQFDLKLLRKKAGLVFQFPEYQLFERTVLDDVAYGPLNFGSSQEEAKKVAKESLKLVGIDESYFEKSPFELSGGEKRRVAIAGILALNPEVLILDEPTAGLDPNGEKYMMSLFRKIYNTGKSVILVTHNMDIVLKYVDQVGVMDHGQIVKMCDPLSLFQDEEILKTTAIDVPEVFKVALKLKAQGMNIDLTKVKDVASLADQIKECYHE